MLPHPGRFDGHFGAAAYARGAALPPHVPSHNASPAVRHYTGGPFLGSEIVGARYGHEHHWRPHYGWHGANQMFADQAALTQVASPAGYDGPEAYQTPYSQPAPGGY